MNQTPAVGRAEQGGNLLIQLKATTFWTGMRKGGKSAYLKEQVEDTAVDMSLHFSLMSAT